jgi:cell division septation protein DedD
MASQNKSLIIVLALVVAGGFVLFLSLKQGDSSSDKKIVMREVFEQKPVVSIDADKDPVPSPAIVTSPEHGQEAGFAVQVYSFRDQKRADVAVMNLKSSGYKAYIEMSDLGEKGIWYRVRIGGLANDTQAKALLETIRKSFNSGIIIKPKI